MHGWRARVIHEMEFGMMFTLMTLGFSLRVEGRWRMPRTGPLLVVVNHQSFLDPILIGLSAPRRLTYLARKTLFRRRAFTWLIRHMGAFPIDHEGVGKEGIRTVLAQLDLGQAVVMFPEGSRTEDGKMLPLRPGIHLLIRRVQAPIVPIGIAGAFASWPRGRPYPIPAPLFLPPSDRTIATVVGSPIDAKVLRALPREQCLERLFQEMQEVQQRAEELRRGYPSGFWNCPTNSSR